jgi:rhamnulose-1-phosphate aldolase
MTTPAHPIRFVAEAAALLDLCWGLGWNEANGGNFSWRLPTEETKDLLARTVPALEPGAEVPLPAAHPSLDGELFLVTGSGQFFRHAAERPDQVLGIVEIVAGGTAFRRLWGHTSGARPTMEFPTHLVGHDVRKRVSGGRERVILHAHVPELVVLSYIRGIDGRALTRALWEKMPECLVLFPDGIRIVPPLMPSTVEIAEASAKELEKSRVILWSHHGIFVSEESPDKAFALVETIEKAAAMHRKTLSLGVPIDPVPAAFLRHLADQLADIMVCRPEGLDDD